MPPLVTAVGVFVNWQVQAVAALAASLRITAVQFHGDETPEMVNDLSNSFRVIKAFPMRAGFRVSTLAQFPSAAAFLLDGFSNGLHGGTGRTADWSVARKANRYGHVILAGGINPENVAQAIAEAQPFAVDVASGVESKPGKKDHRAMRELMREVESANRTGLKETH